MNNKRPVEGDIVQVAGHGRAMIVVIPDLGEQATWEGIANAVVCEWKSNGTTYHEGFAPIHLEVVGSVLRRSNDEVYDGLTATAIATITALVADGLREQALGALRIWSDLAARMARDEDRLRLQQLVDRLPANSESK